MKFFLKKSLNGHVTVVGGHATVDLLSNNVFWTFQAIRIFLKNVAERSRDSGRRSRYRRPTVKQRFLDISSDLGEFWKKSLNGHATVVGGHATVGRLSNNVFGRFKRFGKILKKVAERSRDNGWGHATVGRLSNNVFWTFQAIRSIFEKKSLNGHATVVGGHATVGRLSNNVFGRFKRFGKILKKSRWTVTRQWLRSRDRRLTVKTTFLDVSSN